MNRGAWIGLVKLLAFLIIGSAVVGAIGYYNGGWSHGIIGGAVGAAAVLYGFARVVRRSRQGRRAR